MTQEPIAPPEMPDVPGLPAQTFVERERVHPFLFVTIVLIVIFFLYHGLGSLLTFFLAGVNVTSDTVAAYRGLMLFGQVFLLLIPTLVLARLFTRRQSELFPWRIPRGFEMALAIVGLMSLQQMLQVYLEFQGRIPLPVEIKSFLDQLKEIYEQSMNLIIGAHSYPELGVVVLIASINPAIMEELLFRGLVQGALLRAVPPARAILITGIVFGVFHLSILNIVPLIALGCFFAFLRVRSNSLFVPMTAHFVNNLLAVVLTYFAVSEETMLGGVPGGQIPAADLLLQFLFYSALFGFSIYAYMYVTGAREADED